jgi:hypothetical protein
MNMTMYQSDAAVVSRPDAAFSRSTMSFEFEALWRSLPKEGIVPHRAAFRPERAARFLRHLILCDVTMEGVPSISMRLVGSEFEQQIQRSVTGQDYLQFLPRAYHASAMESLREIVERPCGLWQITPLRYDGDFARSVEITAFPLLTGRADKYTLLVLTQFIGGVMLLRPSCSKFTTTDTAIAYRYIDLGAGVPL